MHNIKVNNIYRIVPYNYYIIIKSIFNNNNNMYCKFSNLENLELTHQIRVNDLVNFYNLKYDLLSTVKFRLSSKKRPPE